MMYENLINISDGKEEILTLENNILTITTLWFVMMAVLDSMPLFIFISRYFSYKTLLKKVSHVRPKVGCDKEMTIYINIKGSHMTIDKDSEQAVLLLFHKSLKNWHDNDRVLIKFSGAGVVFVLALQFFAMYAIYFMHCCHIEKIDITWLLCTARLALSLIIYLEMKAEVNLPSYKRVKILYKGIKPSRKYVTSSL